MSFIYRYEDGTIKDSPDYSKTIHCNDGPAVSVYNPDGSILIERWYINNLLHRIDGPAEIWYNQDTSMGMKYWYINGKTLTKKQFEEHPLVVKYMLNKLIKEELM